MGNVSLLESHKDTHFHSKCQSIYLAIPQESFKSFSSCFSYAENNSPCYWEMADRVQDCFKAVTLVSFSADCFIPLKDNHTLAHCSQTGLSKSLSTY